MFQLYCCVQFLKTEISDVIDYLISYLPYHQSNIELPPVVYRFWCDSRPNRNLVRGLHESTAVMVVAPGLLIGISLHTLLLIC
jgi:hypothetical protein